jgi:RNA polymerase sigma-70 factor (ECF subfamily)
MDRVVVERARSGDRDAFASLVHQVSDSLFAVAFRILRDTGLAEDALQNALVAAWRQLPHLRDTDRFDAWIHRVLVHACYAESRSMSRSRLPNDPWMPTTVASATGGNLLAVGSLASSDK